MTAHLAIDRFGRVLIPKAVREVQVTRHHGRLILNAEGAITGDPVRALRDERRNEVLGAW
ncbi:hypothetical protein GCM10017784_20670 [Deinococcus indicus]|uniref:hypothetical protein n=1 Tax=Deinococcus indicus TaxID=223556 RepID=UPI00174B5696|nr:hypothetical protein [Deinococcus indicus]GHG27858.1 hypothetical protein GCM10017784_20670 [Deinococcus indicus]